MTDPSREITEFNRFDKDSIISLKKWINFEEFAKLNTREIFHSDRFAKIKSREM